MSKVVIALGGNALGDTPEEQQQLIAGAAKSIVDMAEKGHQVVIAHGNGPQVGTIIAAMESAAISGAVRFTMPFPECGAMSQGYIGYDLQNSLREELLNRGMHKPVATILTQVEVDPNDPAFQNPTKPIGTFMTEAEAEEMRRRGNAVMEDAGRGWRRCVASPLPKAIVEIETVRALMDAGQVVVACGGGGIPVYPTEGNHLKGAGAVIDKDFASELLAEELDADALIILTAVEKVAVNFGKPDQKWLDCLTPAEAKQYAAEGQFAPGSMLPKVQAAVKFAESKPGRTALITLLEKAKAGIAGETGTSISM